MIALLKASSIGEIEILRAKTPMLPQRIITNTILNLLLTYLPHLRIGLISKKTPSKWGAFRVIFNYKLIIYPF